MPLLKVARLRKEARLLQVRLLPLKQQPKAARLQREVRLLHLKQQPKAARLQREVRLHLKIKKAVALNPKEGTLNPKEEALNPKEEALFCK